MLRPRLGAFFCAGVLAAERPDVADRLATTLLRISDGNGGHGIPHAHLAFIPEPKENFLSPGR